MAVSMCTALIAGFFWNSVALGVRGHLGACGGIACTCVAGEEKAFTGNMYSVLSVTVTNLLYYFLFQGLHISCAMCQISYKFLLCFPNLFSASLLDRINLQVM